MKTVLKNFLYRWVVWASACLFIPLSMDAAPEIFDQVEAVFEGKGNLEEVATKLKSLPEPNIIDKDKGTLLNHIIFLGNNHPPFENLEPAQQDKIIERRTKLIKALLENSKIEINKTDEYFRYHHYQTRLPLSELDNSTGFNERERIKKEGKEQFYKKNVRNMLYLMQYLLKKGANPMVKNNAPSFYILDSMLIHAPFFEEADLDEFLNLFLDAVIRDTNAKEENFKQYNDLLFRFLGDRFIEKRFQAKIIKLLIDKGLDIITQDDQGRTLAHKAVLSDNYEVLEYLVDHYTDSIKKPDNNDDTPLHLAKSDEVAQLLIKHGADVNAKNKNDKNTLEQRAFAKQQAEEEERRENSIRKDQEAQNQRAIAKQQAEEDERMRKEPSAKKALQGGKKSQERGFTREQENVPNVQRVDQPNALSSNATARGTFVEPTGAADPGVTLSIDDRNKGSFMIPLAVAGVIVAIAAIVGIKKYNNYQNHEAYEEPSKATL